MHFDKIVIGVLIVTVASVMIVPNIAKVEGKGQIFLVQHENKEYQVTYLISGMGMGNGVVKDITAEDLAIKTTIQSEMNALLILYIPIELLNATHISYYTNESSGEIFVGGRVPGVFVDGKSTENYTARLSQSVMMFKIPFEADTEEIEIVGNAVPEFDGLVSAVMGMSIAGIVIASVKYRIGNAKFSSMEN